MRYFKVEFIDPMCDVTFLCPNKKVTKEVVRSALLSRLLLALFLPKQEKGEQSTVQQTEI